MKENIAKHKCKKVVATNENKYKLTKQINTYAKHVKKTTHE